MRQILFVFLLVLIYLLTESYSQQCSVNPNISKCQGITCGVDIGFKYMNNKNTTFCDCSWDDLGVQYTECDTGNKKSLFYYFKPPATCLNFPLPNPISNLDCNFKCPEGSSFDKATQMCTNCAPGSFSFGGNKESFKIWGSIPQEFSTYCERVGTFSLGCNPWVPRGNYIDSGDNIRNHNMRSILARKVEVLSTGYVRFDFRVEAEEGYDYFYFQIDDSTVLRYSTALEWRAVNFNLTAGPHTLKWVFYKDISISYGLDQAQVRNIEIGGIGTIPTTCSVCPPGYASNGRVECAPCPAGFYAPTAGSSVCLPCEQGYSSFEGSASCFAQSTACTERDYYRYPVSECENGVQNMRYDWIKPKSCNDSMEGSVTLPQDEQVSCQVVCKPGQQKVGNTCQYCEKGYASADGQTCNPCESGTASQIKSFYMDQFHYESWETAPLKTECKGACVSSWRFLGEVLDSGLGNGISENALIIPLNQHVQSVDISLAMGCIGGEVQFFIDNQIVLRKECSQCFAAEGPQFETVTLTRPTTSSIPLASNARIVYNTRAVTNMNPYNCSRIVVDSVVVRGMENGGASQCETCTAGTFAQDHDLCVKCPAGQYSGEKADACQNCAADQYSKEGSSQCFACGNGLTSAAGSGVCHWKYGQCRYNTKLHSIPRVFDLSFLHTEIASPVYSSVSTGDDAEYFFDICRTNGTSCGGDSFFCRKTAENRFVSLGNTFDAANMESGSSGIVVTMKNNENSCYDNTTSTTGPIETIFELKCRPKFDTSVPTGPTISKVSDCKYKVTVFRSEVCPLCTDVDYYETQTGCVGGKKEYRWIPKTDISNACANGIDKTTNTTITSCFENAIEFPWWVLVVAALIVIVILVAISGVAIFLFLRYRSLNQKYSQLMEENTSANQQL